jgi:hypothetical protein
MVDVTDLETRSDSKWVLTSLNNPIYCGDIVRWDNECWLCIYDKLKNAKSCNKVKIQPCKITIKLPFFQLDENNKQTNIPIIKEYPILTNVYITDIQESSTYMAKDADNLGVTLTYDKYTALLDKEFRIFLFGKAWQVVGVDYTNIDFMNTDEDGTVRGYLRLMIKVSKIEDSDNVLEKVCDYYKYFKKGDIPVTTIIQGNQNINILDSFSYSIDNPDNKNVNWILTDLNGNSTNLATIISQSNVTCKIKCGNKEGKIKLSTISIDDNSLNDSIQINIRSLL